MGLDKVIIACDERIAAKAALADEFTNGWLVNVSHLWGNKQQLLSPTQIFLLDVFSQMISLACLAVG